MNAIANRKSIAYFSMEIGVDPHVPTYAGGLGVLAGDTIRSAADMCVPMVAVTLLHRQGYFAQRLDASGWQFEEPVNWNVANFVSDTGASTHVAIEGRTVAIRCWKYDVVGMSDFIVPVYFLDTNLEENSEWDRTLTNRLYGGDSHYRLCQEVILGIGGVRMLRALGHGEISRFHMNEGHAALLTIELLRETHEQAGRAYVADEDMAAVRDCCVFTTHTPVPAGHDQFDLDLVDRVFGDRAACGIIDAICHAGRLNMTFLALSLSRYVNGVSKRHGELCQHMDAQYMIDSITNGVHAVTWVAPSFAELFDRRISGWRQDNFSLRYALRLSSDEIWAAHRQEKRRLVDFVNRETNAGMDVDTLTIGFARRATSYKRADLIFTDVDRLTRIARDVGPLQLVFAGKAHPADDAGKHIIQRIVQIGRTVGGPLKVAYLVNFDVELAKLLTGGVDVWLNTPEPPLEASGTSGMKAALNGIPSLSVLDGWWIEGCIEGITGWAVGDGQPAAGHTNGRGDDAGQLYDQLQRSIIPLFYNNRNQYVDIMRHAIALNGSFFNTQRMLQQYVQKAYF